MRVHTALVNSIRNGEYKVGSMLPPESELTKMFSVSRTTIRKAVNLLSNEQYVYVKQGRGTEVISNCGRMREQDRVRFHNVRGITEKLLSNSDTLRSSAANITFEPAPFRVAKALEINVEDPVYKVQRLSFIDDDIPFMYKMNYLRTDVVNGLEKFDNEVFDLYSLLADEFNVVFDRGSETVTAVCADFVDAKIFNIKVGDPLLLFKRYAYTADKPMEYCEMKLRPEYYELSFIMQGAPGYISDFMGSGLGD